MANKMKRKPKGKYRVLSLDFSMIVDDETTTVFWDDKDVTEELQAMLGDDDFLSVTDQAGDEDAAFEAYLDTLDNRGNK